MCTRTVYFGLEGQTVTGRNMDWLEDMQTNLWIFPRGLERNGGSASKGLRWTSKYGNVISSVYDAKEGGTADGMNEKGLVANQLFLGEAKYPTRDGRPELSIAAWPQYFLDSFATTEEAVNEMRRETFIPVQIVAPTQGKGTPATMHLSISDPSGDSAIFEYINNELVIHHGREYQVMTNSPTFDEQLAMNEYWKYVAEYWKEKPKDGDKPKPLRTKMLPGSNESPDRFARASYYINTALQSADAREAAAVVFSVMRNVSQPRGIRNDDWSTIWRTVSDQKNLVYYFEDTLSPSLVWVDLKKLDFSSEAGVRKLQLQGNLDLAGDQTSGFTPANPFPFLIPQD